MMRCPPYLCLISTDYEKYDLRLTFSLQVNLALGIDYMHNGSIHSYGIIFPEIKEHGYGKSGILVNEALEPPLLQCQRSFEGQGHIVEKRLWTYPKVYVQSFKSLSLLLHNE